MSSRDRMTKEQREKKTKEKLVSEDLYKRSQRIRQRKKRREEKRKCETQSQRMDALGNKGAYEDKTELDWTGLCIGVQHTRISAAAAVFGYITQADHDM